MTDHPPAEQQPDELAELRTENAKLIRWHREDEKALAEMRDTIEYRRKATGTPLRASQPSSVSESAQSPTGAPEGAQGASRIALTRSDLAVSLAHHADVLAAQLRTDPARDAWVAAERLTEHANELTTEEKPPAVTELLDNIWTFPLEQQPATTEDLASADNPTRLRWGLNDVQWCDDDSVIVMMSGPDREPFWLELDPERAAALREDLAGPGGAPSPDRDALIAELLPAWEAMYEPGNVSTYLIGYANSEAGAKGAAEAWMRSQAEVTGRLEWEQWSDATTLPDGYDALFELIERHDDGIDTGPGIAVRRRIQPTAIEEQQ